MPLHNRARNRKAAHRRDNTKKNNYGATLFHEVKRYDGKGNLIETITPDELIARPIGITRKYPTQWQRKNRAASLTKTKGEGSKEAWNKVAAAVNKGARVGYKKEKV
jgi:hypothetical protein